jgi:hypothetical protein
MPRTFWEFDELLFASAVRKFDPWASHPHPPGYPLYVGLAKGFAFLFGDAFRGLVALSVIACAVGCAFLARAFRQYLGDDVMLGVAGALIFYFSPGALVHLALPLSDSAALMFLAMTLYTATLLTAGETPADQPARGRRSSTAAIAFALATSATIGVRPQLALPLLPVFLFVIVWTRDRRKIVAAFASFTALSAAWFLPLMFAAGGWNRLVAWELHQASYVAAHDASMSRGAAPIGQLIACFVGHPFGPKLIAGPLLLLAVLGVVAVCRRRNVAVIVALLFGAIHLAFALAVMEPADAVRYSLPHVMIFCLLIAGGLGLIRDVTHLRSVPLIATALIAAVSLVYVWPLIAARTRRPSPPFAAAEHASLNFPPQAVIAYDLNLRPHAEYLMSRFRSMPIDRAMKELSDSPEVPVFLFVNGGSRSSEAKVFAWPTSHAYRSLTRNLYDQVTLDPLRPNERFVPVRGVYSLERTTEGEEWRWLAQDATIRLPRAHGDRVSLVFAMPHDSPSENVVHIGVNGREVAAVRAMPGRQTALTIDVPRNPNVELTFRSARAFRPAETIHNRDPRVLAVELVKLE